MIWGFVVVFGGVAALALLIWGIIKLNDRFPGAGYIALTVAMIVAFVVMLCYISVAVGLALQH